MPIKGGEFAELICRRRKVRKVIKYLGQIPVVMEKIVNIDFCIFYCIAKKHKQTKKKSMYLFDSKNVYCSSFLCFWNFAIFLAS